MKTAEFEAAGLYDAASPNAAERLELASQGATIDQMVEAAREASLASLAGDLALRPRPSLTIEDIAARVGIPTEQVREISLATGLAPGLPNQRVFTDEDAEIFLAF